MKNGFLWLLLVLGMVVYNSAANSEVVRVEGIEIEMRASSGVEARDKAFARVQKRAIELAFEKSGRAQRPLTSKQRAAVVRYLEPHEEKVAPGYYRAVFAVGVDLSKLDGTGESTGSYQGMPDWVLVVPVHRNGGDVAVWSAGDPWTQTWRSSRAFGTLWVASVGDDQDRNTLAPAELLARGGNVLADLGDKYRAPAVVLTVLDRREAAEPGRLTVVAWSSAYGRSDFSYELATGEENSAVLTQIKSEVQKKVALSWQKRAKQRGLSVRIPATSRQEWQNRRNALEAIPGVSVTSPRVRNGYVEAVLIYQGSRASLLQQLRQKGILRD